VTSPWTHTAGPFHSAFGCFLPDLRRVMTVDLASQCLDVGYFIRSTTNEHTGRERPNDGYRRALALTDERVRQPSIHDA